MNVHDLRPALHTAALWLPALVLTWALPAAATPSAANAPRALISKQQNPAQELEQRMQRALEHARAGHAQPAIASLRSLLHEHPESHAVRLLLANLYITRGELPLAQNVLEQGLTTAPQHAELRMSLARVQMGAGDTKAALSTLEAGWPPRPSAQYRAFYAALLQSDGQAQRAIDHYAAALQDQPQRAQWWVGLAVSLHALGMNDAAREAFDRARNAPDFNRRLAEVVTQYGVMP